MTSQKGVVTEPGRGPGPGVLGGAHRPTPPTPARETACAAPQSAERQAGRPPLHAASGPRGLPAAPGGLQTHRPRSRGAGGRGPARGWRGGGGFPSRAPQRGQCKGRPQREAGTTERTLPGRARVCAPECGGLHGRARAQGPRVRGTGAHPQLAPAPCKGLGPAAPALLGRHVRAARPPAGLRRDCPAALADSGPGPPAAALGWAQLDSRGSTGAWASPEWSARPANRGAGAGSGPLDIGSSHSPCLAPPVRCPR